MKRIAILASGSGTNAENIYNFFANGNRVSVPLVIYDRAGAGVAERMQKYPEVQTLYIPGSVWKENPEEILALLKKEGIDMVVLAGFLRFVPQLLTDEYAGRMLNIHPSLLPAYGGPGMYGDKVHQAVIAAGETKSGVTVHYVSDKMDEGEVLLQEEVEVTPEDTPSTLARKIHEVEYRLYPRAIVEALSRLREDAPAAVPPPIKRVTPPPMPTAAEEWADVLGVKYDPSKIETQTEETMVEIVDVEGNAPAAGQYPQPGVQGAMQGAMYGAYGQPGAGMPSAGNMPGQGEKMPPTNLIWSVVMTLLCCLPTGIVAIVYSSQVTNKYYAGDYEGAKKASRNSEIWIIVSFVLGIMINTLYFPLMLLF